jgi:adenylylsulfate kinase
MTTWVLLAGLPATGKSSLAQALQSRLGGIVLDKDRVRSALFPGAMTDYTREQDDLCMRSILDAAASITHNRRADFIFLDGRTFSRRVQVDEVLDAARQTGAEWRILHLTCSDEVAETRLSQDDPDHPARNRDMALYQRVKENFEPIEYPKLDLDTSEGIELVLDAAGAYLVAERVG